MLGDFHPDRYDNDVIENTYEDKTSKYVDSIIEKLSELEVNDKLEIDDNFDILDFLKKIKKLSEVEVNEEQDIDDNLNLDFLKKTQEDMLKNAVYLEKLIEGETKKEEKRIEYNSISYLIKLGLCLFWFYFLLMSFIISNKCKN